MASDRDLHEVAFIKSIFTIVPFGSNGEDAEAFGRTKAMLYAAGCPLDDMDLLIGTSALVSGYTLVTHNIKHFSRIAGLNVEDWLA